MWLIFGMIAVLFAFLKWREASKKRELYRWASLSFTSLTLCAFYSDGAARVIREDWGGLMDTMPTLSRTLWICALASIFLNGFDLFKVKSRK